MDIVLNRKLCKTDQLSLKKVEQNVLKRVFLYKADISIRDIDFCTNCVRIQRDLIVNQISLTSADGGFGKVADSGDSPGEDSESDSNWGHLESPDTSLHALAKIAFDNSA